MATSAPLSVEVKLDPPPRAKPSWASRLGRWVAGELLHLAVRCSVATLVVLFVLSCILLLLSAVPLADTPDADEPYLRSAAYLSLRWKIEGLSPPPPSPPPYRR